ncbi:MAG: hypothetical protein HY762_00355 [Planctomycetes bacterium]|nr:hypothetical protein [Planctomycetota bacterium]
MLFRDFLKRIADGAGKFPRISATSYRHGVTGLSEDLPHLFIFTGTETFLKEKGLLLLKDSIAPQSTIKRFSRQDFKPSIFWNELYAVPFLGQGKGVSQIIVLDLGDNPDFIAPHQPELEQYLASDTPFSALVILAYKCPAILVQKGWMIECLPIPEYELVRWVSGELKRHNKSASAAAIKLLIENTGNDLAKIDEALAKLALFTGRITEITDSAIGNLLAPEAEYEVKELGEAIINKQPARALTVFNRLSLNGEPIPRILGYLRWYFGQKSNIPILKKRYQLLLETDLAVKTGQMPEEMAMQTLLIRLTT